MGTHWVGVPGLKRHHFCSVRVVTSSACGGEIPLASWSKTRGFLATWAESVHSGLRFTDAAELSTPAG